jgi:phenylpyruvate tautomerase PptA (4-oxalocrotonate tautomerase family)
MPNVLIETRGGWLGVKRPAFLAAIQAAMVETLRIPPHSLVLRLVEHPVECFVVPHETHETAEQYTHIAITMFAGRSVAAKRALFQAVVRHLEPFGVPPGDVRIILQEVPRENVGMQGGKAAVDLELGYEVRV